MSGGAGDCCREPRASIRQWRTGAGTGDACSSSLRSEQLPMRQGPCNDLHAGLPDGSSLLVPEGGVRLLHFPPVSGTALRSGSQFLDGESRFCASCERHNWGGRLANARRSPRRRLRAVGQNCIILGCEGCPSAEKSRCCLPWRMGRNHITERLAPALRRES